MAKSSSTKSPTERFAFYGSTLVALGWMGALLWIAMAQAFRPYVAETDWKQAVWQYWRYSVEGAFPPGHFLTDSAFVTHAPPVWWAMMASLSTLFDPIIAANILNIIAFIGACASMYFLVRKFANHYIALVAACMVVRMPAYFAVASGGYARSFGQTLILLFLALWAHGRHKTVLVVLLIQAGLYPSAVVPCGLCYGLYLTYRALRFKEWRAFIEVSLTGVGVGFIGLMLDWSAPDWWGPMATLEEAWKNPAMQAGGRSKWVPLTPMKHLLKATLTNPFRPNGWTPFRSITRWHSHLNYLLLTLPAVLLALYAAIRRLKFPFQIPLMFACTFAAYLVSRQLAFRMYLPRRMLQHSMAILTIASVAILLHLVVQSFTKDKRKIAAFSALGFLLPILLLAGPGLRERRYRDYSQDAPLYQWVEANTKVLDQFAGNYGLMDEIPLFSKRQVYMNWKMAHMWRAGYFAEVKKRTQEMYGAYYATDLKTVLDFAENANVQYFITHSSYFSRLEKPEIIFNGIREDVVPLFDCCEGRFVLENPPEAAVVFRHGKYTVIDMAKLRTWAAKQVPVEVRPGVVE